MAKNEQTTEEHYTLNKERIQFLKKTCTVAHSICSKIPVLCNTDRHLKQTVLHALHTYCMEGRETDEWYNVTLSEMTAKKSDATRRVTTSERRSYN